MRSTPSHNPRPPSLSAPRLLAIAGLFTVAAWQGSAVADGSVAQARAQFQQGLALETTGDWAGALALFQQVAAVKLTPQVRFNIATCEEHIGKLALALGDYKLAAAEAEAAGVAQVSTQATERAQSLGQRLPHVVVRRGAGAEFSTIGLDGVTLGSTAIGVEMPVDPGPHSVEARAPGFNVFTNSFNVAERETKTIEVTLARPTVGTTPPEKALVTTQSSGLDDPAPSPASGTASTAPFLVGGIGAASLVTSGVFFLMRQGALSDLDAQCGPNHDQCPASSSDLFDKGKTYTTAADITFVLGIVGLGAGAILYVAQKPSSQSVGGAARGARSGAALVPTGSVGLGSKSSLGAALVGRF